MFRTVMSRVSPKWLRFRSGARDDWHSKISVEAHREAREIRCGVLTALERVELTSGPPRRGCGRMDAAKPLPAASTPLQGLRRFRP